MSGAVSVSPYSARLCYSDTAINLFPSTFILLFYLRKNIKAVVLSNMCCSLALGMVKWMAIETEKKFEIIKCLYLNGGGKLLNNLS